MSAGKRASSRASKPPSRFKPGGSADVPSSIESLIRSVTTEAAGKSSIPLSAGAISALEEALEPAIGRFLQAVGERAAAAGRPANDADFASVLKQFKKGGA